MKPAPPPSSSPPINRQTARTQEMISGPIGPILARLAAPNVLAMVVQAVVSIAEGVFASELGI